MEDPAGAFNGDEHAEIVVIGGGAVGCAVAWRLAESGHTDVLLLEKEPALASVTTSQAAGLVGQVRTTAARTRLAMDSVETFSRLQRDTDVDPGWRQTGSLRLALCEERVSEFRHMKDVADQVGLDCDFIDQQAARDMWPLFDLSSVKACLWCPSDGYLQPYDLTMAYAAEARSRGVRFLTETAVEEVIVSDGRVAGVETTRGTVRCKYVVNAAGAHAYHLARSVGLELPIVPVRHEFLVTVTCEGLEPGLPVVRIPDVSLYLRAETSALLCGGWEANALSADPREFAIAGNPPPILPDWDVLGSFAAGLAPLFPEVNALGVRTVFKGWPTFTPDGRFIIGESSRVPGFVMAGGCNAHGVSGSAGIARHVVEAMFETTPSDYVLSLSPDRFAGGHDWNAARQQAQRHYETYYALEE